MKKRLLGLCLAACMLTGLTGCGEQAAENLADSVLRQEDEAFLAGQQYKDETAAITLEAATLSDCVMAPLSDAEDGSVNGYYASDEDDPSREGNYLYLDCVSTVENIGSEELDLQDDLYFYCTDDNDLYDDCMILTESADGVKLDDAGDLAAGETARVHYALLLPEDISWTQLKVYFIMPGSTTTYAAPLSEIRPNAKTAFSIDTPITASSGAVLTFHSCSVADEATALTDAGGGTTLQPITSGNQMVDISIEVANNGSEALTLGTLYGGYAFDKDNFFQLAWVVLEADNDMKYSGSIAPDSTVMTHLLFELPEEPTGDDLFYLYIDGTFYSIDVNGNAQTD